MTLKISDKTYRVLMTLVLLILVLQMVLESQNNGDFIGYLNAGNRVLEGKNIYRDYLNTWPPFFSLLAVPLALADKVAPTLLRFFWLLGGMLAFFATMRMAVSVFLKKKVLLPFEKAANNSQVVFHHPIILVPILLVLRLAIEHNSHLQINFYMMALAMGSIYYFNKGKLGLASFLLGFSIAIKVYTVLILIYFLYKQAYRFSAFTIGWVLLFSMSTFLFFGPELASYYHDIWWIKNSVPRKPAVHMNQGLQALVLRLFTAQDTGTGMNINLYDLPMRMVQKAYYLFVLALAVFPAIWFRKKMVSAELSLSQVLQWAILFASIPLLSPVGWKYYYVFLWLPYFVVYYLLFYKENLVTGIARSFSKILFVLSIVGLSFSSELFWAPNLARYFEVFGVVTWGGVSMFILLFVLYLNMNDRDLDKPFAEV